MQISTKFLLDNAATGAKVRLTNSEFLRSRNAANSSDINMFSVNSSDHVQAGANVDMDSFSLINLPDPTTAQGAATKAYTDAVAAGLSPKSAAQAASATALPTYTYLSGVITATSNAALVIDTYTVANGDRILVKNETSTNAPYNGIYVVTDKGSGSTPFILTRSSDADAGAELVGASLFVLNGSQADTLWVQTVTGTITVGTTNIAFTQFGNTFSAGNGINISGSTVSVKLLSTSGLGFSGSSLTALVQGAGTANTTAFDGSGNIKALKAGKSVFTLGGSDITNQYVDLSVVAHTNSINLQVVGGPTQQESQDYSVSYTGGSSGNTRITFLNALATGGGSALISGDVLLVAFSTL